MRCAKPSVGPEFDRGADIERQIAGLLGEGKQALERRDRSIPAGRLQIPLLQMGGPGLEIGQCDPGERFADQAEEARRLGGIGAPGMRAGLQGKPELDQGGVLGAVVGGSEAGRSHHGELVHSKGVITICAIIVRLE